MSAQWKNSRGVVERIFIRGRLVLETPAHFGCGDSEGMADLSLMRDPLDGSLLLTGASIAGALRSELRERQKGHRWAENLLAVDKSWAEQLFGCLDDAAAIHESVQLGRASVESWIMVDDALGSPPAFGDRSELRDGVSIDARSGTVRAEQGLGQASRKSGQKYDIELLAAGTTFNLGFELWLTEKNQVLLGKFAAALLALEEGRIPMGSRKRRGLGRCRVTQWTIWRFAMDSKDGLLGWLRHNGETGGQTGVSILELLGMGRDSLPVDHRRAFSVDARFILDGSLLIRSEGEGHDGPDTVYLTSWRGGERKPILSGTSAAGAMRGRALRIAQTILPIEGAGAALVDALFGKDVHRKRREQREEECAPSGSCVRIEETEIAAPDHALDRVQSRVRIDRFTGGAFPQALFSEQPIWGRTEIQLKMELARGFDEPEDDFRAKVGLLLLVIKDLATGDLPLGGESSVGRGLLRGKRIDLAYKSDHWTLEQDDRGAITPAGSDLAFLQDCVGALGRWQPRKES